jgi:hypothetical protein
MPTINRYTPFIGKRGVYLHITFFNSGQGARLFRSWLESSASAGRDAPKPIPPATTIVRRTVFPFHGREFCRSGHYSKRAACLKKERQPENRLIPIPCSLFLHFPIDIPGILAYAENADEFVRQNCRDRTGWRRDEWAYGPLFICGKFPRFWGYFPRFLA